MAGGRLDVTRFTESTTVTENHSEAKADALRLDQFLKLNLITETGGQAKLLIQSGEVKVNGEIETRRRRKLAAGDTVEVSGKRLLVKDAAST